MSFAALILAGSRPGAPDPVATAEGIAHKALADLGGRTLLERVHGALVAAGAGPIAVSASDPQVIRAAQALGAQVLPTGSGPSESVDIAFARLGAPLLVTTADHGLLQPAWITDFLHDAPPGADVALVLAERALVEAAVPGTRRTWLKFADGAWSGCNLFLLNTDRARAAIDAWKDVQAHRKQPWRIAGKIGLGTLWRYAIGRLSLDQAIARLGRTMGIAAAAVPARDGRAAVDVDKVDDLVLVRRLIAQDPAAYM